MLFSNKDIADYINNNFEPAWESVRPVPIVRIDFGEGKVVTRTLHGNIATYLCDSNGFTLDILPGIYEPCVYLDNLRQFRLLTYYVGNNQRGSVSQLLLDYHVQQAKALASKELPSRLTEVPDVRKVRIEGNVKVLLVPGSIAKRMQPLYPKVSFDSTANLGNWKELLDDTKFNETARRLQIHKMLAAAGLVHPNRVMKQLYKDVLHADLDDPYLGLGPTLFASYPFTKEDAY